MTYQIMEAFLKKAKAKGFERSNCQIKIESEKEIVNKGMAFKIRHILQKDKCYDLFKDIEKKRGQDNLLSNENSTKQVQNEFQKKLLNQQYSKLKLFLGLQLLSGIQFVKAHLQKLKLV